MTLIGLLQNITMKIILIKPVVVVKIHSKISVLLFADHGVHILNFFVIC